MSFARFILRFHSGFESCEIKTLTIALEVNVRGVVELLNWTHETSRRKMDLDLCITEVNVENHATSIEVGKHGIHCGIF